MTTRTVIHDCPNCGGHEEQAELVTMMMTERELLELADGMRHWWNDDNPDGEQLQAYNMVAKGHRGKHDKYVADLEDIVAELYERYERANDGIS